MIAIRRLCVLVACGTIGLAASASGQAQGQAQDQAPPPAQAQAETTERFSKTTRLDRNGSLDLSNVSGNIVITGGAGEDVVIDAIKRVNRPNPRAAATLMALIDIQVVEQANRVEVRTVVPRPRNFPGSVDFTVAVPTDANVTVRTFSGNIRVSNVGGELRAETVNGNIVAAATRKIAALKGVSGDIDIIDAAADDVVTATTVSGGITVRGLRAQDIELSSVTGNIRVEDAQAERMVVRAVNGNVDYSGDLVRNGRYQFVSHSGDVRLQISGATGFELQANSFNGSVRSDFPINRRAPRGEGPAPAQTPRAIRGAFGDASAMLVLRAFSGDISITRR